MIAVVDRLVQYPNRYKLTNAETGEELGTFDFEEETGTVQQVGTEINKALFDSIAADLAARVKLSGGELANTIVTFPDVSGTAANVASGDTSATLWGKVKNWFSRLKALAFKNKVAAGDFEAGAIKNVDVAADAAIAQSKVSGLMTDYVASISVSGRTVTYKNKNGVNMGSITTQDTTYGLASRSSNGLMSSTDKTKLDGIESGAQKNTVLGVKGSSESAYRTGNVNITKANVGLGNVDNVKQYSASNPPPYPVKSVNGKTGAVTLAKGDVGLSNVDNVKQYSSSNPPPYPVTSVNGKTGAVNLDAAAVGAATSAQGAKADSAAQLNKAQTWTQEQRFNAGFTALNGNFAFSDTTNIGMEIGRRDGTAGTPYIDFHTDGSSSTDYNSRILATGNQLQVTASGGFSVNGHNIEELDMVVDSGNAITMTAPASGDTVQAPANGWFCLILHSTGSGFVALRAKKSDGADKWGAVNLTTTYNAGWPTYFLPVKSGDYVMMTFTNATANRLQFIRSTSLSGV